jgi:FKBP-type peptidyl-prolyl cis-trans isomerase
MRYAMVMALGLGLGAGAACAQEAPQGAGAGAALTDLKQKASYGVGLNIGRSMKAQGLSLDADVLARGIKDGLSGGKTLLTDEQLDAVMQEFQKEVAAKQATAAQALGAKNQKEGAAFLAANKAKQGVQTLPSGLQYKVIKAGAGATPTDTDLVTAHYRGTLVDGTEFDSSYARGEPAQFPVTGVIPGWTEALKRMKVGDKWQIVIPSDLAYGANPRPGGPIGPNATLIFDIELLGVQPGGPQPGAGPE